MKESTRNNFILIARGACLGYVICFCLGLVIFYFGIYPFLELRDIAHLKETLYLSSYFAFWGMGLGIATELSLESKSFRSKLVPYFVGILFSPALISVPIFNLIYLFTKGFNGILFFPLLTFVSIGSSFACLHYIKAKSREFITYLIAYFSLCFAFFLSICLTHIFLQHIENVALCFTAIYLSFALLSLIFSLAFTLKRPRF